MRKLFLLLTIIFVLIGCTELNDQIRTQNQQVNRAYFNDGVVEFGYKGHDYIMFRQFRGYQGYGGVVHNPDCHCFTDKK